MPSDIKNKLPTSALTTRFSKEVNKFPEVKILFELRNDAVSVSNYWLDQIEKTKKYFDELIFKFLPN